MVKELMARGQATITALSDAYTIVLSPAEYLFPATSTGTISSAITVSCEVQVTQGDVPVSVFTIGAPVKPAGFKSINVDNAGKRVTFFVAAGTTTLEEHGKILVPITVADVTYFPAFIWSKAKAGTEGTPGKPGADANMLDWVKEWNTGKTLIDQSTVITPKIFAGVKNVDGTINGTAIGQYTVTLKTASGAYTAEKINGICGFKQGTKTFFLDSGGNVQLGNSDQYIKYNAATGKVEFGAGVSLQWVGATYIDRNGLFTGTLSAATVSSVQIDASQITAGKIEVQYIDVASLKASLLTADNIEALSLDVKRGKVGGWTIDADSLFRGVKNNFTEAFTSSTGFVTLGSKGLRGYKWRLDATGSGSLAGGNIAWDSAGNVSFADSVSVSWQKGIDLSQELSRAMSFGKMLFRDPTFRNGVNGIRVYNNLSNGNVTIKRVVNAQAPNDSGQVLEIIASGEASPGLGGFFFGNQAGASKIFITRIIAKIPIGYKLVWASNATGTGGQSRWLTPAAGTGKWEEYIYKVVCGEYGAFTSTDFFYLNAKPDMVYPVEWQVAFATVFDITACEKFTTTINAEGIYTGSLTASQITTGTLSAARLDASGIKASIINTDYINGLSCNFVRGKLGGWIIGSDNITAGVPGSEGDTPIQIRSGASGSGTWYNGSYRPMGISLLWFQKSNAGHLVLGQVAASAATVKSGFFGLQMMGWDNREYFCLSANTQHRGSNEVYNRIAGWAFDHQCLWKNNITLGADGSITNATKWKFNNDGSGQVAAGNISWDATGSVAFAPSVSLNWTAPINSITSALGGASYPKLTKITAEGIYTGALTAVQVNAVAIDASSISVGTLSSNRIATGSLDATKLDADSIKSSIINTEYINGLDCTFTKGTIGGWSINKDSIIGGTRETGLGFVRIALNATLSDSEEDWLEGNCRPMGSSMIWSTPENEGHLVIGQVAELNHRTKKGYIGIQMLNRSQEYFCLSAKIEEISGPETYNRIAGWSFDYERIWKNSVSLGANGSISNGTKWQMNNDGSGRIAAGNISWDAAGNVTFTSSVSIAWTAGVDAITTALGGATYPKLTQITATGIYTGKISAAQISVDSTLVVGGSSYNGSISVRDAVNNVKATLDRRGITAVGGKVGGWIINNETICAAAPASGHRIFLSSSGYMYNDNPNTGKDYWGLRSDGSATFGYGTISFAANGSGFLAGGNLSWDTAGNLIGKDATLEDIFMTGTFRSPFVAYDGSINIGGGSSEAELHDNLTMPGGGGWILASDFPWDATQNGRTVTIVNYKYNGSITTGKMQLSAPTGKYFFEDGLLKSSILLSREYVLLKGYGEGANFYGWIVMHRGDIGTVSKYGSCAKVMYQGWVENGKIIKYKSFDGGKLTCSKTATGTYQVSFPTGVTIPILDYTVMVTGSNIVADTTNQVYASLTAKTTTNFVVKTADDSSRNNASFTFQVISMADWSN